MNLNTKYKAKLTEQLMLTQEWDKTFPKSEHVECVALMSRVQK